MLVRSYTPHEKFYKTFRIHASISRDGELGRCRVSRNKTSKEFQVKVGKKTISTSKEVKTTRKSTKKN